MSKRKTKDDQEQLIYCGPSLPRGVLIQFTTYRNGLPKHLESHFEKCASIKRLFVPVDELSQTLSAINQTGSSENVWFNQVSEYIKGGAK